MNELSLKFFEKMSKKESVNPNDVKLAKNTDCSEIDVVFVRKYAGTDSIILDMGAGTGLMINKMYKNVSKIVAVEPFESFSKFIVKADNVEIINDNVFNYIPKQKFDIIIAFGMMHYVDEDEAITLYNKYINFLKDDGKIIVKNQFGVHEDVNVSGYSEEQKTEYWSQYRHLDTETKILGNTGFKILEISDIYPPEHNRWENTHFYAIVAQKK